MSRRGLGGRGGRVCGRGGVCDRGRCGLECGGALLDGARVVADHEVCVEEEVAGAVGVDGLQVAVVVDHALVEVAQALACNHKETRVVCLQVP